MSLNIGPLRLFERQLMGPASDPLLIRYVLLRVPRFGIYVHRLCRSDYDRALHDHPWPFISVLIRGGYWEVHDQTIDGRTAREWHGPGSILLRPAEWRHRFELGSSRPSWTLVIVGRRPSAAALGILFEGRMVLVEKAQLRAGDL